MKKIKLVLSVFLCLILTGCGNAELDLDKVSQNLNDLTSGSFDMLTAVENIEMNNTYFGELLNVYDFDLEDMGINKDNIENMAFRVDNDNNPAYIIIKPVEGKKESVKKEINKYLEDFTNLNKLESEYEGHLIYLFSDNNDELLKTIKKSKSKVFGMLMNVESTDLEALTNVNPDDLEEFLVKNSVMTQASSYYILKPKVGREDKVEEAMDDYMDRLEEQWKTYLPDQYELVENRLEEEYGDYLIYIISNNNELVFKTIKKSKK